MTARTATRPRPKRPDRLLDRAEWWWAIIPIACLALVVLVTKISDTPRVVDHITVDNPGDYTVNIEVSNGERSGWLALGAAGRSSSTTMDAVLDQGETWVFR